MKKFKRELGFTLIEILSVISILATIALIILPIVTNYIENSRREAFKDSILHGMKSIQNELAAADFAKFPSEGIKADSDKTGLEKNPFISGLFKKPEANKDIYAFQVTDGRYCATGYKEELEIVLGPCYLLDKTEPIVTLVAGTITSRSIQVVANAIDEESNIVSYEFSKDNGKTWTPKQKNNSYNFDMLTKNTSFTIKVKVTNENSLVAEKSITLKTNNIDVPTYTSNPPLTTWSKSKVITIHYPARQTYFIYEYSTDGGSSWTTVPSGTTQNVTFNKNGTLVARVRDGYNTVTASALTLTTIDISAPGVASATVRYDSNSGTVRGNNSAWTNRTLWWGSYTASDTGGSGINRYEYSTGCTGSSSGTLSTSGHTYSSNTNYTFCIRAVDNAGNVGPWSGAYYFRVDKTAPTCSSSGGGGWTNSNLSITGRCSGDSGGSGCSSATASRTFTTNTSGTFSPGTISDNAGNKTTCPNVGVYIDKTPPTCSSSGGGEWTTKDRTLVGTCSDTGGSGCNGNVSRSFTSEIYGNYSPGNVVDKAGNSTACPNQTVAIDRTKPYTPVISSIVYSQGGHRFSCTTTGKTTGDVTCNLTTVNGKCSGWSTDNYALYGDTAGAVNSGYTIQAQYSCTGAGCWSQLDGTKRYGNLNTWTKVNDLSNINFYAGKAGSGVISKSTLSLRLVDGAGNVSGILRYNTTWCV